MIEEGLFVTTLLLLSGIVFSKLKLKTSNIWKNDIKNKISILNSKVANDATILQSLLIDIDKLFEHAMKMKGIIGESAGDRLKNAAKYFEEREYNKIWKAHKIRNVVAHEATLNVTVQELKDSYETIKFAIHKLLK